MSHAETGDRMLKEAVEQFEMDVARAAASFLEDTASLSKSCLPLSVALKLSTAQVDVLVRRNPIGGDPRDFCLNCKHHEMNHASYADMNRACNQTGCDCREYVAPEEA